MQPLIPMTWLVALVLATVSGDATARQTGFTSEASEASEASKGRAILAREYAASHGYVDYAVDLTMELRSKTGKTTRRGLSIKQMEGPDATTMTMVTFREPRSIRGTGLLTHSHPHIDDDQWLFIPGLNRSKRIAARDRTGAFVGSAFSYEDLADATVDEFDYIWQGVEACGEFTCDTVKRIPLDPHSGYAYQIVWVDQTHHRIRRMHLHGKDGELMKTLKVSDYRPYSVNERTMLFPHVMQMENVKTGRGTSLHWGTYVFAQQLSATRDFSTNALRRVR